MTDESRDAPGPLPSFVGAIVYSQSGYITGNSLPATQEPAKLDLSDYYDPAVYAAYAVYVADRDDLDGAPKAGAK